MEKKERIKYFDKIAPERDKWKRKNKYYYQEIERLLKFIIPPNSSILEIGCSTGDFIGHIKPKRGLGIDFSPDMIKIAKEKYPEYEFLVDDAEDLHINEKFDYVIMSDLIGHLDDVWQAFRELQKVTKDETRVIITYYNYLWEPILKIGEILGFKMKEHHQNWLCLEDIENLLILNGYEVIKKGHRLLFPKYIPFISFIFNKCFTYLPLIKNLCLIEYLVARERNVRVKQKDYICSIIIPTKNEAGNIEDAIKRTPKMGKETELIFVDGHSRDGTIEKIEEMIRLYPEKNIKLIFQDRVGKKDAVMKGLDSAEGDILFILDSDLTVPPKDLSKFYLAISEGKGEFINGSRLVYPLEKDSMRFLNKIANRAFGLMFSFILEQRIADTLCGTKVFLKRDYERIKENQKFFGDFDPFGDYELLFGAAKLNLKMIEVPVRYKPRTYGKIKIQRFRHGLLLLKMALIAFKKFKLT
ncbi:MAG: glycosyltransferase [bacterium]